MREHNNGEGADIVIDAVGPGAPAESFTDALATLRRGGIAVDIGGMMERPALDLFSMMCSQISLVGSLWFSTREAQDMAEMAGAGALDPLGARAPHLSARPDQRSSGQHPGPARRLHELHLPNIVITAAG